MTSLVCSTMAMAMDDIVPVPELDFYYYSISTTTTTTPTSSDDQYGCKWNHWSPVVNWDTFTTACGDDFHDLIDSMMDGAAAMSPACDDPVEEGCNSAFTTTEEEAAMVLDEEGTNGDDFRGLRLVHLLMAAAEALTSVNKSRDLARVILVRLKELVSHTDGTNMERLATYFTDALQGLLEGASDGEATSIFSAVDPTGTDTITRTALFPV